MTPMIAVALLCLVVVSLALIGAQRLSELSCGLDHLAARLSRIEARWAQKLADRISRRLPKDWSDDRLKTRVAPRKPSPHEDR